MKFRKFRWFYFILAVLLLVGCSSKEEKKTKFYNKGQVLYEKGDYVKASLEFRNAIQIDPNFARAYYMLGMAEFKEKSWQKAFGYLSKAVELDPEILDAQVALGSILMGAGEKDKAGEKADLVLSREPANEDALVLKAAYLMSNKKEKEAEAILKSVMENNPKKPDPYLILTRMRLRDNDPEGAIQQLRDLLTQDAKNQRARLELAQLLESLRSGRNA